MQQNPANLDQVRQIVSGAEGWEAAAECNSGLAAGRFHSHHRHDRTCACYCLLRSSHLDARDQQGKGMGQVSVSQDLCVLLCFQFPCRSLRCMSIGRSRSAGAGEVSVKTCVCYRLSD